MRSALLFNSLSVLMISGFVAVAGPARVYAGDDGSGGNLWDKMLQTLNLKTTVGPSRDFVEATHPDPSTLKFLPTGAPHPKRATPARTAADIAAAKAALDAARDAQLAPPAPPAAKPTRAVKHKPAKRSATAAGT